MFRKAQEKVSNKMFEFYST